MRISPIENLTLERVKRHCHIPCPNIGLPAEALAKAGGGEGSRTPVLDVFYISLYMFSYRFGF